MQDATLWDDTSLEGECEAQIGVQAHQQPLHAGEVLVVMADEQAHQTVQGHLPIAAIAGAALPGVGRHRLQP